MQKKMLKFVKILSRGLERDSRLSIFFDKDYCKLVLDFNEHITVISNNYTTALEKLLLQLPPKTRITFKHDIFLDHGEIKLINEIVETSYIENSGETLIKFTLCVSDEEEICVTGYDDFGIALKALNLKLNRSIETCAYCSKSDFMSNGGEDVRHGWFCFRDVIDVDMTKPWYERIDKYEKANPNMSSFYWCPEFQYKSKVFA